ncbi:Papain-like cysteine peptidase superfamily [Forsythia ovata]|uniref:Papain-like cysteine peptidase superfamily n=1 Tax=Forsythia ovata TaxID=205694 RepID=A0ABD1U6B0_9LAMI
MLKSIFTSGFNGSSSGSGSFSLPPGFFLQASAALLLRHSATALHSSSLSSAFFSGFNGSGRGSASFSLPHGVLPSGFSCSPAQAHSDSATIFFSFVGLFFRVPQQSTDYRLKQDFSFALKIHMQDNAINPGIAKPEKKTVNIPMPEGQTTVTVDSHLNLEKMIDNVSSHNINFNAKSVEEEAAHHKSSNNKFEHSLKAIHSSTNLSTNGCAGNMDKKGCCFSKQSIMMSINALQSKHKQLCSDQFKMKMEIHNLFTNFAKSIVDGIETVTSIIIVDQLDYFAPPQHDMQNDENHRTTIEAIQDSRDGSLEGRIKKRRMISEDIESNDKVGNEINAIAPMSLLDDEIVFSEEDFRHMDESAEKNRCRAQNRPAKKVDHVFLPVLMDQKAHWILVDLDMSNLHLDVYNSSFKTIRDVVVLDAVEPLRQMISHIIRHSKVLTHDIPDKPLSITLCKDIPHQTNG